MAKYLQIIDACLIYKSVNYNFRFLIKILVNIMSNPDNVYINDIKD